MLMYMDGTTLKTPFFQALEVTGTGKSVPLLLGTNKNEGGGLDWPLFDYMAALFPPNEASTPKGYENVIKKTFPNDHKKLLEIYPASDLKVSVENMRTDSVYAAPTFTLVSACHRSSFCFDCC